MLLNTLACIQKCCRYLLIKNEHDTKIGIAQISSINTPTTILPISAPTFPNVEPIDTAIPLRKK